MAFGTLGIVFGAIGTSPIYAFRESFEHPQLEINTTSAYGVASIVFWSLLIIISAKYLFLVMRADNHGEGGILALTALVMPQGKAPTQVGAAVITLGVFGTALLYGDGLITPAISVLSAVEGFEVATSAFSAWVIPVSVAILVALFAMQHRGTAGIARVFSPIMVVWFTVLGALGLHQILRHPAVLRAVSPSYGLQLFVEEPWRAFLALGSIFLVVTGGEALYADMGHFGRRAIQISWYALVLPGLLLNYFGQAAMLAEGQDEVGTPFYDMAPDWAITPLAILATLATVIASQALISGAFSLTAQAVQLDYFPRLAIHHTSARHIGQVYVPLVNWMLMLGCVGLVVTFRTSSALASAYGIAVTGTMTITSVLFFLVCRRVWKISLAKSLMFLIPFLAIDLAFFSANAVKILAGGWLPLSIGAALFVVMTTWWRGRQALGKVLESGSIPDEMFLADLDHTPMHRVSGSAVFMASSTGGIPNVLLHHVKHNKVLHKQVVLFSVMTQSTPWVQGNQSVEVKELSHGFYRVSASIGFMQRANVPKILLRAKQKGLELNDADTTYYLGRQKLLVTGNSGLSRGRKMLFSFLSRNARPPTDHFNLPPNRVVELGLQIEI